MVNICTDFNLTNTTFHIKNIKKLLPFIYITSPASPASRLVTVIQCVSLLSAHVNVTKIINTKKSGMWPPNLYIF
jgi:hypothetical protein